MGHCQKSLAICNFLNRSTPNINQGASLTFLPGPAIELSWHEPMKYRKLQQKMQSSLVFSLFSFSTSISMRLATRSSLDHVSTSLKKKQATRKNTHFICPTVRKGTSIFLQDYLRKHRGAKLQSDPTSNLDGAERMRFRHQGGIFDFVGCTSGLGLA